MKSRVVLFLLLVAGFSRLAAGADFKQLHMDFLAGEVARLEKQSLEDFATPEGRERRRQEALEMFGLSPLPERTDLHATITGRVADESVVVEKIHFQSRPHLYVTANFYLPKQITKPLPAVLYVCGHAEVKTNGVSYGNKTAYQHHGAWFARNGYACLVIDTLQLGEIEGLHHGTYREGRWWWNSRGYSPAGVEAWNEMRAIDYLETRPEVDKTRIGVTGRSGGGAYSWSAIALDPRVKVAAPVAGITDLRNHVVDGVVEGHCDCMFFVNTYGWDYPMLAALAAPRPLLIVNSDKDSIFPLDGVERLHRKVAGLYKSVNAANDLGLVIGPGPHKDTQDLQMPVFRWFNHYLRGADPIIDLPATNHFTAAQLKVFEKLPEDQLNTTVDEWFVEKAPKGPAIKTKEEWVKQRENWMVGLKEKVFRNWPKQGNFPTQEFLKRDGEYYYVSDPRPLDQGDEKAVVQLRRRYMLAGQTVDSMRVFDIVEALKSVPKKKIKVKAKGALAMDLLVASLFVENVEALRLQDMPLALDNEPKSPFVGARRPDFLNFLRVLDVREVVALALERADIEIGELGVLPRDFLDIQYSRDIAAALGWNHRLAEVLHE